MIAPAEASTGVGNTSISVMCKRVVRASGVLGEAVTNQSMLNIKGISENPHVNCAHVITVHPDLTHLYIDRPLAHYLCRRSPGMLWEIAEPGGGWAVGLKDCWVA